jgi:hypothetical protein
MKKAMIAAVDARLMHNYRQLWADLVSLNFQTRARLAWMMINGDSNLDKAKGKS